MEWGTVLKVRRTLSLVHRALMTFVTIVLGGGAVLAWWYSTPANQLLLIAGMLGLLALMAGLSIFRHQIDDAEAATLSRLVEVARATAPAEKVAAIQQLVIGTPAQVTVSYGEPEVHRVENALLEDCKQMAAEGASIDSICRAVDPEHDQHDLGHQEAFRKIVRAMIEQG